MKKLYARRKPILLTLLIVVTSVLIVITSISFYKSLQEDKIDHEDNKVYGTVLETGKNYVKIQSLDNEVIMINSKETLAVGDFIVAYFDEGDFNFSGKNQIEVIARSEEIIGNNEEVSTTQKIDTTTTTSVSTKASTSQSSKRKTVITSSPATPADDAEVVSYFASEYDSLNTEANDQTLKEKAKEKFITFVDFIFYDGEIKGKKFNDLKASAKAKVIYYTLLMDAKIDSKWPGYKDNISSKYKDIKAKLVAKYMEITTSICENNEDNCTNVKNDFALLKNQLA